MALRSIARKQTRGPGPFCLHLHSIEQTGVSADLPKRAGADFSEDHLTRMRPTEVRPTCIVRAISDVRDASTVEFAVARIGPGLPNYLPFNLACGSPANPFAEQVPFN